MIHALRTPAFGRYWLGQVVSFAGNTLLFVALPFYVYDLTGSALATGAMFMAQMLPQIALSSLAGVWADRYNRIRLRLFADVGRAAALLPLLLVDSPDRVWIVYVVAITESTLTQVSGPATLALIPRLVAADDITPAMALFQVSSRLANVVGPALGGVLLATGGIGTVVVADAATYLFSAAMMLTLPRAAGVPAQIASTATGVWRQWLEGLAVVRRAPLLAAVFLAGAGIGIADGLINASIVVYVRDVVGASSFGFGLMLMSVGAGAILSAIALGRWGAGRERALIRLAPVGLAVTLLGLSVAQGFVVVLVLSFALGFPGMAWGVGVNSLLAQMVPDGARGRVFGAWTTLLALSVMVGLAIASLSLDAVGARVTFLAAGLVDAAAATILFLALPRPLKVVEVVEEAPVVA